MYAADRDTLCSGEGLQMSSWGIFRVMRCYTLDHSDRCTTPQIQQISLICKLTKNEQEQWFLPSDSTINPF